MGKRKQQASNSHNETSSAYLIRFPDREARLRAIVVLGEVGVPYCGLPDDEFGVRYGVTSKHLDVLRREGIAFEVLS